MPARQALSAAASLKARLADTLALGKAAWGESGAMSEALAQVRRRHDSAAGEAVATDRLAQAVAAFRRDGKVTGFVHLKHVCLGATMAEGRGRCLLAEPALRERLFALAEHVPGPRRKLKAFQCLLRAYWVFPRHGARVTAAALAGFVALAAWLTRRRAELAELLAPGPRWFALLGVHANLLGPGSCDRYGPALLRGDAAELQGAVEGLAIPRGSWVLEEAVLAQARAAAALDDAEWNAVLPQLLNIAAGRAGVTVTEPLARRCVALLLARHARCDAVARHDGLLDAAVAAFGNPWQQRAAWDAQVLDATGRPCELAREMAGGWLKHYLIGEFFRLYGGEGGGRRTAYWQRYDPFIAALWVGLEGPAASAGDDGERFARRAAGSLLKTGGTAEAGPVLLLRIGDFLAVETGGGDGALRLHRWSQLDPGLLRALGTAGRGRGVSLAPLAQAKADAVLEHRDGVTGDETWEERFDRRLRPQIWSGGR